MNHTQSRGTALVTGASRGIGAIYADRLAKRGHDLILVARDEARIAALAARIENETGHSVTPFVADLNDKTDLTRVEAVLREDPTITMLVNNAGVASVAPLLEADVEKMEDIITLNVTALTRSAPNHQRRLRALATHVVLKHSTERRPLDAPKPAPTWAPAAAFAAALASPLVAPVRETLRTEERVGPHGLPRICGAEWRQTDRTSTARSDWGARGLKNVPEMVRAQLQSGTEESNAHRSVERFRVGSSPSRRR